MPAAKQEAESLTTELLPFAQQLLRRHGEFYPYGGLLHADGSVVHVGAEDPDAPTPDAASMTETLRRRLREGVEQSGARAAAIVCWARVTPPGGAHPSDAIEVLVQHREGYCANVFFPCQLKGGRLTFGQVFAQTCGKQILG